MKLLPLCMAPEVEVLRRQLAPATAARVDRALELLRGNPELGTPLFGPLQRLRASSPSPGLRILYLVDPRGLVLLRLQIARSPDRLQARLGAVVLAAGRSRHGRRPTQLAPIGDRPGLVRTIEAFLGAPVDEVVVVLGYEAQRIRTVLASHFPRGCASDDPLGIDRLVVTDAGGNRPSLGHSLQKGMDLMPPGVEGVLVGLGNRPLVASATISSLIERFRRERPLIVRPTFEGQPGHPVLFDATLLDELARIRGEEGGRSLIARHGDEVLQVGVNDPGVVRRTKDVAE